MQKCTVHGSRTKPDIKHIFTRLNEHKSFISSSCIIITNIKCTFWQVSILENRFRELSIRPNVHSDKCQFWKIGFRKNVHSAKCTFWQVSILENRQVFLGEMSFLEGVFRGDVQDPLKTSHAQKLSSHRIQTCSFWITRPLL